MRTRRLADLLETDNALARLSGHAARLARLQAAFASAAPRELLRGARVANFKLGKVVILADNGAVAAKLRQIVPRLGDVFKIDVAEVTGIDIRVQPRMGQSARPPRKKPATVSTKAKQGLTSLADRLPADSALRKALESLVDHT